MDGIFTGVVADSKSGRGGYLISSTDLWVDIVNMQMGYTIKRIGKMEQFD